MRNGACKRFICLLDVLSYTVHVVFNALHVLFALLEAVNFRIYENLTCPSTILQSHHVTISIQMAPYDAMRTLCLSYTRTEVVHDDCCLLPTFLSRTGANLSTLTTEKQAGLRCCGFFIPTLTSTPTPTPTQGYRHRRRHKAGDTETTALEARYKDHQKY